MAKHERTRYELVASTFERVGVRLFRLPDTDFTQKPADQYGFVLGNREDRGRMVFVETKEVYKKSEVAEFSRMLFDMLSPNQKMMLAMAAYNGCYVFVAYYCQEGGQLHLWKLPRSPQPFKEIGNKPPNFVLDKLSSTKNEVKVGFDFSAEQFLSVRSIFE